MKEIPEKKSGLAFKKKIKLAQALIVKIKYKIHDENQLKTLHVTELVRVTWKKRKLIGSK